MSNHLESAGYSLKKSAKNLTTIIIVNITIYLMFILVTYFVKIENESKLVLSFTLLLILIVINFVILIIFIGNINDTGNSLIYMSESSIFNNISTSPVDSKKKLKTKNLKGVCELIQDKEGNFFLAIENRRYYYDSVLSADNSLNHYYETGNLLEDGLIEL